MLEIVIVFVLLTVLQLQNHGIGWMALVLVLVLPGVFAMMRGAPFIPTSKRVMERMLALAAIRPDERVYDLGCGDGRLVFAAAAAGARATGFELSLPTFLLARIRALRHPGARILLRNFWRSDLRDADVVFCYLLPETMQTFHRTLWPQLKSGCRVVSHAFKIEGMTPAASAPGVVLYVKP